MVEVKGDRLRGKKGESKGRGEGEGVEEEV